MKARFIGSALVTAVFALVGCGGSPMDSSRTDRSSEITDGTLDGNAHPAHPQFTEASFFLHDVGVVILGKAFKLNASQYGRLPSVNQLEALKPSAATTFTAVGYGLQRINPAKIEAEKVRMDASPHLIQIDTGFTGSYSLLLSNNASTGGTCFGDSGGPNYLGTSNTIAGVTSFGLNGTCGGTGGVFRLDRNDVLDFVNQYVK
jgi:Trypsin